MCQTCGSVSVVPKISVNLPTYGLPPQCQNVIYAPGDVNKLSFTNQNLSVNEDSVKNSSPSEIVADIDTVPEERKTRLKIISKYYRYHILQQMFYCRSSFYIP